MEQEPQHDLDLPEHFPIPTTPVEVVLGVLERRGITALDVLNYLEEIEVESLS